MCGIACFFGREKNAGFLIDKLKRLEYRGYDSAGIAILNAGEFTDFKAVGNISNLEREIPEETKIKLAISHTRWATHGEPSALNAHPHFSKNRKWAVVHNGIIENYQKIKENLKIIPESSTDTAVISQILEERNVCSLEEFVDTVKLLEGSYALVCLSSDKPNTMFFAKQKSPLFLSRNCADDILIASDPICFDGFADEFIQIKDAEFGEISDGKIRILNAEKQELTVKKIPLGKICENSSKGEYPHFMIKEIMEEETALQRLVSVYEERKILEKFDSNFINKFKKIVFIGCGTAYHAGLIGSFYVKKFLGKESYAEISSEFVYNEPYLIDSDVLCFFVSQSGETADTLRAFEIAKQAGATTIALTNVMYSSLARSADYVLPTCAGVEIAVASTKAYVCQILAIYMFAKNAKIENNSLKNDIYLEILEISRKILKFDTEKIEKLAGVIAEKQECVFIGKGIDYVTAKESALKLKEVSYLPSSAYPSGELKHGYLATITSNSIVIAFACDQKTNIKTINSAKEALARGATVIYVSNEELPNEQNVIKIDDDDAMHCPALCASVMQLLAYKVSVLKNLNPDQPRNLAKSVTVE